MSSRIYLPKASKNHIRMVQHLMRIGANMVQNQGLEGVWGAFGRLQGSSWATPGSKALLCRFPGAFWAAFRRFLKRLGRLLGGS